jgi:hypothetical protein
MKAKSFKTIFYRASDVLSDCWKDGWSAINFTLWHHSDVEAGGTYWHLAMALQATDTEFASWVQFWDHDSKPTEALERRAFRKRLTKALRQRGYKGNPSTGLLRKRLSSLVKLRREWQVLQDLYKEIE